ncbi:MAG: hypothetical protein IJZ68_03440 [Bacteroidaceae bacterium]|nr:hypothetical protein [Bacteroidaceae bacterium]
MPTISQKSSQAVSCIELFGKAEEFLCTFNPDMQYKYCKDVNRCYIGKAPSLKVISEAYGENITETWLEIQLRDLSEFAGCKDKLSIQQIEQIAKVIILEFSFLKATELMHFFILFKSGKFGKFYGAVDGLVITEALQEFRQLRRERLWELEQKRAREERARRDAEYAKNAMSFDEWKELKHLFNMGYEPWRIKAELEEQRKQENQK